MHVTRRIRRHVAPLAGRIAPGLLGAAALLAAACGGNEAASPLGGDAVPASTVAAASEATAPAPTPAAPTASPVATPEVAVAPRDDGLTGAPIPPPTVRSVEFDADLVNDRAGAFPPLDFPAVVAASEASWMSDDELVLGAVQNGEARAYQIFMLRFHHVANDELGGEPYLVTF